MYGKTLAKIVFILTAGVGALWGQFGWAADRSAYYFIAATPAAAPASYASCLYRLGDDGQSLVLVRTLTTRRQGTEFVRVYDDAGLVVVASEGSPHRVQFDLVHFEDPARSDQVEADAAAKDLFPATSLFHSSKLGTVIGMIDSSGVYGSATDPFKASLRGLTLNRKPVSLTWEDYAEVQSTGYVLGSTLEGLGADHGPTYGVMDGELRMGYPGGTSAAPFVAPDLSSWKNKNGIVEIVHNSAIRLLTSYEMTRIENGETLTDYLVLNIASSTWSRISVPGTQTSVTAFGGRVAFVVGYDARTYKGKAWPASKQANENYASLADRLLNIARPGRIVLIDMLKSEQVDFAVDSADTDVLRIEGSDVLYRVGPALYRRTWSSGKLSEPEKLLTDHAVGPAIHWAFKATR